MREGKKDQSQEIVKPKKNLRYFTLYRDGIVGTIILFPLFGPVFRLINLVRGVILTKSRLGKMLQDFSKLNKRNNHFNKFINDQKQKRETDQKLMTSENEYQIYYEFLGEFEAKTPLSDIFFNEKYKMLFPKTETEEIEILLSDQNNIIYIKKILDKTENLLTERNFENIQEKVKLLNFIDSENKLKICNILKEATNDEIKLQEVKGIAKRINNIPILYRKEQEICKGMKLCIKAKLESLNLRLTTNNMPKKEIKQSNFIIN